MLDKKSGFTIIEIIVVIAIIGIIIGIGGFATAKLLQKTRIESSRLILQSTLESARNKSTTAQEGRAYGVQIVSGSNQITQVSQDTSADPILENTTIKLKQGVLTNVDDDVTVMFSKLTGRVLIYDGSNLVNLTTSLPIRVETSSYRVTLTLDPNGRITASPIQAI